MKNYNKIIILCLAGIGDTLLFNIFALGILILLK